MNSDDKLMLGICGIIATAVILIAFIIAVAITTNNRNAFENGYERQTLQGYSSPQWVKISEKGK